MSNASQANDGDGHMQTPHKFDVLVQKKINQNNKETFYSKNYVHGIIWHPSCTVNGSFMDVKMVPSLSWAEFKLYHIRLGDEGNFFLCRQKNLSVLKSVSISAHSTTQSKLFSSGWVNNMEWTFSSF